MAVSSESLQGNVGAGQSISSCIYPLERLFTFSTKHKEHYQISLVLDPQVSLPSSPLSLSLSLSLICLVFDPQAPLVAGISIMVRPDYAGAGFSGICSI